MRKVLMLFLVCLVAAGTLSAREYKGVTMPDTLTVEDRSMVLNGMALRKKVVFKVYVAGLYLEEKMDSAEAVFNSDSARRTVMHFLRKVGADKINEAWLEGLAANTPDASSRLKQQFDQLCAAMEDMADGEQIVFTWIPGTGTRVEVKGNLKDTIAGREFADALFACWIGDQPGPGEDFKQGLLGN